MDFEYRIFKFVPQVDRFVNEQMQFKLQECSYKQVLLKSMTIMRMIMTSDYIRVIEVRQESMQIILYINYVKIKSILLMKKSI